MRQLFFINDILARFRKADISIFHDFSPPPTGGGHQFMRALQKCLTEKNYIIENNTISPTTGACLFNSFNFDFNRLSRQKQRRPECRMIHRVDGPIASYRGFDDGTDKIISEINQALADITVFQSNYSLEAHRQLGLSLNEPHLVISNTADPRFFYPSRDNYPLKNRKVRLISTSWSDNPNKGLETYKWLDKHLDWQLYEYTFVGRIQAVFKNIRHMQPVDSATLASYLQDCDIFITASRHDPCSNSVLEALACGLPVLFLDSGGHPELVNKAGLPFSSPEEIPELLAELIDQYDLYQNAISIYSIDEITSRYLEVMDLKNG